jgi:hypothetical protein
MYTSPPLVVSRVQTNKTRGQPKQIPIPPLQNFVPKPDRDIWLKIGL